MVIYINDEESLSTLIIEDKDDIFDIIRNYGDDAIVRIVEGTILKDVTDASIQSINVAPGAFATGGIGGRFLSSLGARNGLVHEINKKLEKNEKENFVCFFETEIKNNAPIKTDTLDIRSFKIN